MDGEDSRPGSSLEAQLRTMILSNVTISSGQANQENSAHGFPQHRFRGRGRGRGGFFRGRGGRGNRAHAGANAPTATGAENRFGKAWAGPQLDGCQSPSTSQAEYPSHVPVGEEAGQMPPNRQRRPRVPRQPQPGVQQEPANRIRGQVLPFQQPKILQRPQQEASANQQTGQSQHHSSSTRPYYRPVDAHPHPQPLENPIAQVDYLDHSASQQVPKAEISLDELEEKESFRQQLESICQKAFAENYSGDIATISLVGFGSLASGFATPGSDMDLAIVPGWKDPSKAQEIGIDREIPRLLERAVLDARMGGRLLTRTRVPILKVCQTPTEELYNALTEERQKWEALPEEEQYAPAVPPPDISPRMPADSGNQRSSRAVHNSRDFPTLQEALTAGENNRNAQRGGLTAEGSKKNESNMSPTEHSLDTTSNGTASANSTNKDQHPRHEKPWLREKALGPLDFPKAGVGIQCDINFENPLGIHNTHLLRCYSLCDPRVRPMVLFVKAWAKRRKINSSYSGTLSSYGWVLMVLHYLVNVANPPVCPNLQSYWRPPANTTDMQGLEQLFKDTTIGGYVVRFWRNEDEILHAAHSGQLSRNDQSLGSLLRGFFQYYASVTQPYMYGPKPPSFYWTNEVLSLRTPGGIRMKSEKGWTGAKTTVSNGKEVRHRYLFCIEDPFELDHNVARTVTHNGIVAIRDEFRRVWRILGAIGRGQQPEGDIFDEVIEQIPPATPKKSETDAEQILVTMGDLSIDGTDEIGTKKEVQVVEKAEDAKMVTE